MERLRVLILSHGYPKPDDIVSGVAVHRQVLALRGMGCDVQVISPVPFVPRGFRTTDTRRKMAAAPRRYLIDDVPVTCPRYVRLPGSWYRAGASYSMACSVGREIARAVRGFHPHVLHAFAATPDGHAALILGKRHGLPTICTLIGSDINVYPNESRAIRMITVSVLRRVDRVVAVSAALAAAALALAGAHLDAEVAYMGCDEEHFRFDEPARLKRRHQLAVDDRECLIVFLGYFREAKGVYELLSACTRLIERGQPVHLLFVGSGDAHSDLVALARKANIEARVHFEIQPSHSDIPGWLSAGDVFALPSHSEGLPLAILEAMACSRPVVATNVGGIPEAVSDGVTGLLTPPRDVPALTDALGALATSPQHAQAMGAAGRLVVEEHFTWTRSAERMKMIYGYVVERHGR
jgi:teichuronic acid biosynthesis glycosyltransferase TuaC